MKKSTTMRRALMTIATIAALVCAPGSAEAGYERTFEAGTLIIPMDLAYQDHGLFQAYGLVFQLLRQNVTVYWVIDPDKVWHHAPCDEAGDECEWSCAEEASGLRCPYPTASPDFFASAVVAWDSEGALDPGSEISSHGYRGGPFVIDVADRERALEIIDAWNDQSLWPENPWAERTVFQVVTVHEASAAFDGYVRKEMIAAPTIAVFSDGNENIATGYLRAAGIPQSNGLEFPADRCRDLDCGPGTDNPDMLTVESVMGDMGTCDAPNRDHRNGALFTSDGIPAYCQIMSMHWDVRDRETVECDGNRCPDTEEECTGESITYHGHEVVAEVRQFLQFPTHFFAECQAVNAYENTIPNPQWPYLDDPEREGHFLTTTGHPPDCPCTENDFECVVGGCDDGERDCCLPSSDKEQGAGFLIAERPDGATLQILHPGIPYNQLDGAFETVGGSEPAYNLSDYLGTEYENDMDVTFITGPDGPGDQDVWMTGYVDGVCDIGDDEFNPVGECTFGKVSYLGGHAYSTNVPLSEHADSQGTRLFLNALFEADCVTTVGQPDLRVSWAGDGIAAAQSLPFEVRQSVYFTNEGQGTALDAVLIVTPPAEMATTDFEEGGTLDGELLSWEIGSIGTIAGPAGSPPSSGTRWLTSSITSYGEHTYEAVIEYRVGVSTIRTTPVSLTLRVLEDADGDGVPDVNDPAPNDPNACGDVDGDSCDDCSVSGQSDPANDGPDSDGDGICDAGDTEGDAGADGGSNSDDSEGCSCRVSGVPGNELTRGLLGLITF